MYFLDCSYDTKDQVKSLGAKWHSGERRWYVPPDRYNEMAIFNPWTPNGKIFLQVPYSKKDEAKAAGAKWDSTVKLWFCTRLTPKLEPWTGKIEPPPAVPHSTPSKSPKKTATTASTSKRGNAIEAACMTISEHMTVPQLQDECRYRGIKGLSGKSKGWLLDQLGHGTIWQSHPCSANKKKSPAKPVSSSKRKLEAAIPKTSKQKAAPAASSKKKETTTTKSLATKKQPPVSSFDWSQAPRITNQLTVAQLSHEILKRNPSAKGLSSKPKSWFLTKLGLDSVWTTSPNLSASQLANACYIDEKLTKGQLMHEIMTRTPGTKGLSSKSKDDLLSMVGLGSVWMTGITAAKAPQAKKVKREQSSVPSTNVSKEQAKQSKEKPTPVKPTPEPKPPAKRPVAKAEVSTVRISKPPAGTSEKSTSVKPSATPVPQQTTLVKRPNPVATIATKTKKTKTASNPPPEVVPLKMARKTQPAKEEAFQKSADSPAVSAKMTVAQLIQEIKFRNPSIKGLSGKSKSWLLEILGEGTPVLGTKGKAKPSDAEQATRPESVKSQNLVEARPATKPATAAEAKKVKAPDTVASSKAIVHLRLATTTDVPTPAVTTMTRTPQIPEAVTSSSEGANKPVASKKKAPPLPKPADPTVVNSTMTIAQLQDEIKYRYPKMTGVSGKNKGWLISELEEGSQVLGIKADAKAKALHVHKVSFFPHPLADSTLLRVPRHLGPYDKRKRVDTATCDNVHPLVCTRTPYRSSEPHDYDICKSCFDMSSLPESTRDMKLDEIRQEQEKIRLKRQHQWQIEQRDRRARWKREEEERERERQKDLLRFKANTRQPSEANTDENRKKKYTVWIKAKHPKDFSNYPEFDSSFDSLADANLRVEWLFFYKNPCNEGWDKENVYVKEDKLIQNQFRYLMTDNDYGQAFTVSAMPSAAYDTLESLQHFSGDRPKWSYHYELSDYLIRDKFSSKIQNPPKPNLLETKPLHFTVWTSCGYDRDGWHSYNGPPSKEFNSSFASLEDANKRAEFVFYFNNPWGLGLDEMSPAETDDTTSTGYRFLECCPEASQRWTVSVLPSSALPFVNII